MSEENPAVEAEEPTTLRPDSDPEVQRVARELALAMYGEVPDPGGLAAGLNGGVSLGCDEDQFGAILVGASNLIAQFGPKVLLFEPERSRPDSESIQIVFDDRSHKGSTAPELLFVEVEDMDGKSISVGEWGEKHIDYEGVEHSYATLVLPYVDPGLLHDLARETYAALRVHGATSEYLGSIGSLFDTLPLKEVVEQLQEANGRIPGSSGMKGLFDLIPDGWFVEAMRENRTRIIYAGDRHEVFDDTNEHSPRHKGKRFYVALQHDRGGRLVQGYGSTMAAAMDAAVSLARLRDKAEAEQGSA